MTWEIIDCRTQEGKKRCKEISKPRASNCKKASHNAEVFPPQFQDIRFLSETILNERDRRIFAGFLARSIGHGGIRKVAGVTGLDLKTVQRGKQELVERVVLPEGRVRREGGGRPSKVQAEPAFEQELLNLIKDDVAGDPLNGRKWVRKTLRWMKKKLQKKGIKASISTIRKTLKNQGISLKKNKKSKCTQDHPLRDKQFKYLNKLKQFFLSQGKPVLSSDLKKKELIGNFKNNGKVWCGEPIKVLDHDFPNLGIGKLNPYGIYDVKRNKGYVYCGTSFDTSEFAVDCICKWWEEHAQDYYPDQAELLILVDSGGSNGYRRRAWKWYLQIKLADRFGVNVHVCHYPTGASKYNPIERKLFSFISKNWAGEPLTSYGKALSFIRSTRTEGGLEVIATLVEKEYEKGLKVTNEQMESLNIKHANVCPKWNYCIRPRNG
ncbi:MAG: ISAzo13 family transposase [Promethearchaeota archaeon]